MKKLLLWLMVVTVVVSMVAAFSLAGCKTATTETTAAETTAAETTVAETTQTTVDKDKANIRIGVSFADFELEKWPREAAIMTDVAAKNKVQLITQVANHDVRLQNDQIENLAAQGCDVIIIIAEDSKAAATAVEKVNQEGIPVIAYDRMIYTDKISCYITGDPVENGRNQAKAILNIIKKGRFVLLGGHPADNNALSMRIGQLEVLQPYIDSGDIKIVADQWVENWDATNALKIMENILSAQANQIDAVVAMNDSTALGAIQALRAQKLNGKIPISGLDATLAGCQAVVAGDLTCTLFRDPKARASAAIEIAIQIAKGNDITGIKIPDLVITPNVLLSEIIADKAIAETIKGSVIYVKSAHILVTKDNIYDTVVKTGYQTWEDVYKDVPEAERPPKP